MDLGVFEERLLRLREADFSVSVILLVPSIALILATLGTKPVGKQASGSDFLAFIARLVGAIGLTSCYASIVHQWLSPRLAISLLSISSSLFIFAVGLIQQSHIRSLCPFVNPAACAGYKSSADS